MYVNTFICLEENITGYGKNKKSPSGHVTIMTPGLIRCYIQDLANRGTPYVLYLLSKANNRAVRVGEINPSDKDKETRWKTDVENMFNSGLKGNQIDAAAIVIEGNTPGNTDAILTGFTKENYLISPLLEKALPKKVVEKVMPKVEEVKAKPVTSEAKAMPKAMPKVEEIKTKVEMPEPKAMPKVEEIKTKVEMSEPKAMPKVEEIKAKVEMPEPKVMPKVEEIKAKVEMSEPKAMPKVEVSKTTSSVPKTKEQTENEENKLKEKIKQLLEDQLKDAINGVLDIDKKIEAPQSKLENKLNDAIKEQIQKIVEDDKEAKKEKEEIKTKESIQPMGEVKTDFCEECEGCTESETEYLETVDEQLRLLEEKLQDTKIQIINMRKGNLKKEEKLSEADTNSRKEEPKLNLEEVPEEYDSLDEYLDYTRVEEIFRNSDPIYPFEARDDSTDWVRISLSELMSIPQLSYEWCCNPCITFCTHKYGHLILGKDKHMGQYYIGIPDQYHPARKSMLATDRVERFLSCKDISPTVGEHGYWMVSI